MSKPPKLEAVRSSSFRSAEFLLLLCAASFVLQPTNIRINDVPASIVLMVILTLFYFAASPRIYPLKHAAVLLPFTILAAEYLETGAAKPVANLLLLAFVAQAYTTRTSVEALRRVWLCSAATCTCLAIVGSVRFLTGYEAPGSQNLSGIADIWDSYIYLGIAYLPATRNSDAFYFAVGAVVSFWLVGTEDERWKRGMCFTMFALNGTAAVLSLSRGVWLSLALSLLAAYGISKIWKYIIPLTVVVAYVILSELPFVGELLTSGMLSLVDPEAANRNVSGYYTYSNEDRIYIYSRGILDFLANPFGNGTSFVPSYAAATGANVVHSENLYLDLLIVLGIFSLPLFYFFARAFAAAHRSRNLYWRPLNLSMGVLLGVYALFNSGIDFAFFWFTLGVLLMTINSTAVRPAKATMAYSRV